MEKFCIVIVVVIIQLYILVKAHPTIHFQGLYSIIFKLYSGKPSLKTCLATL